MGPGAAACVALAVDEGLAAVLAWAFAAGAVDPAVGTKDFGIGWVRVRGRREEGTAAMAVDPSKLLFQRSVVRRPLFGRF